MGKWTGLLSIIVAALPVVARQPDASASATITVQVQPFTIASLADPQVRLELTPGKGKVGDAGLQVSQVRTGLGECLTNHAVQLTLEGGELRKSPGGPALSWGTKAAPSAIGHWTARLLNGSAVAAGTRASLDVELVATVDSQSWKQAYAGTYTGTLILSVQPANGL